MNHDDNTPAFGVPTTVPVGAATDDASLDHSADEIDPDLRIPVKDVNLFVAYCHEVGMLAAEDPRPNTPEEQESLDELLAMCRETMSKPREQLREERRRKQRKASQ